MLRVLGRIGLAGLALTAALRVCAQDPAPTLDGFFIRDAQARLDWPRCVEGMVWTGQTCSGQARLLSLHEAQALAEERSRQDGVIWRVPRLNELKRWSAPDLQALFPNAPDEWMWTSTKRIDTAESNIYNYDNIQRGRRGTQEVVGVNQGYAWLPRTAQARGDVPKHTALVVRLVRAIPPEAK